MSIINILGIQSTDEGNFGGITPVFEKIHFIIFLTISYAEFVFFVPYVINPRQRLDLVGRSENHTQASLYQT